MQPPRGPPPVELSKPRRAGHEADSESETVCVFTPEQSPGKISRRSIRSLVHTDGVTERRNNLTRGVSSPRFVGLPEWESCVEFLTL